MERFKTLLLREWMQHRTGWLVILALPIVLFTGAVLFGRVQIGPDTEISELQDQGALLVAMGTMGGLAILTLALAWLAALIQSPGLARRDVQDRSIEFWLSMPVSHGQSLGATLLAHLLLLPWAAIAVGLAGGWLVSLLAVGRIFGAGHWFALPWGEILLALGALGLRVAFGVVLATLWMSPLILGTMAASAWLKRWGVPAVAGALGIGGLVLANVYDNPIVFDVIGRLGHEAANALISQQHGNGIVIENPEQVLAILPVIPGWALEDAGRAIASLAQPAFVAALAVGGAGLALLWLRRTRGA